MTTTVKPRRAPAAAAKPTPQFYRVEDYRPEEGVGYLMRRILNVLAASADHELAPTGLTSAQWIPLLNLYRGHASTVAELARECRLDVGAMTRTLDRLEAKGLLRRVRSSEDRRVVNLELTAEGRATGKKIPAVLCSVHNTHLRSLSMQEWEMLTELLHRILDDGLALQAEREGKK
jgi:DNA-binding MarR family transcriptional regulator